MDAVRSVGPKERTSLGKVERMSERAACGKTSTKSIRRW